MFRICILSGSKMDDTNAQQLITQIENRLKEIKDIDVLLENILSGAREIVNADAGSIYEYDKNEEILRIRYSQNDTIQKRLPKGEKLPYEMKSVKPDFSTIAGYCLKSRRTVNVADVYNMSEYMDSDHLEKRSFSFNNALDLKNGYRTKSMLTVPLLMTNGTVLGVLQIINAQNEKGEVIPFDSDAEFYLSQFAGKIGTIYEYAYLTRQGIDRLVKMAGFRDPKETGAHVERVSCFALEIYDRYAANKNIPEKERNKFRDNLKLAARCHDIGKVAVPDGILKKQGLLDERERDIMKGHTCVGAQIFTPVENDVDQMACDVCLHHHDRWDGGNRGYPGNYDYREYIPETEMPHEIEQALKGKEIPLSARIVALADVYDALRNKRCYKDAWGMTETFEEIESQRERQFDPELVDAFMQIKDRLEDINRSIN